MLLGLALTAMLTFDQVFGMQPPWGSQPARILWSPDGTSAVFVRPSQDARVAVPLEQLDARTGQERLLIDPARYPGKPATPTDVTWSPDGTRLAFTVHGNAYVRDMATGLEFAFAKDASQLQWSPQANAVAYVSKSNLYVAELGTKLHAVQLTKDGRPNDVLDGELDWVYPEELGIQRGFAWSPDGRAIAYMRMDERDVTAFPIVDFLQRDNTVEQQRYPLAGERNPRVSLRIVDADGSGERLVYDAGARDEYLAAFAWKPNVPVLTYEILDRAQQHLRVVAVSGAREDTLYEQSSNSWVDVVPLPLWQSDGSSLWILDRENAKGLYRRSAAGALTALTRGTHVFEVLGDDEREHRAYVTAAYPTRRDRSLLAVNAQTGAIANLTPQPGDHAVSLAPTFDRFIDTYSRLDLAPQTVLATVSGGAQTVLAARSEPLQSDLLPVERLEVPSQYGELDAYMIEPPGFNPQKRYPVVVYVYGGPEAPTTSDRFGGMRGLYHQLLARAGFIVFSIDGPASQYANSQGVRLLLHRFGPGSLSSQQIGVQYLRSLPYVDASRLGIWGWSFGGYETLYAMTHPSGFKAGVAGSPVTDWHLYDSIYTERYMGMPQNNAAAYDASSDIVNAQLHGSVLDNHGTADENVHMANSIAFLQQEITQGDTRVEFFPYPQQRHGYTSLAALRHIYEHMLAWWQAHL